MLYTVCVCVLNPPRHRGTEHYEPMGVLHLEASVCVGGERVCTVGFAPLLKLCWENCGGGAFMPPRPLTPPPSLGDCASCLELCGWKVCVHVRE